MKLEYIVAPQINVNDHEMSLVKLNFNNNDFVKKNEVVFEIESTKATLEVESKYDGYIYYKKKLESIVSVGEVIAVISKNKLLEKDFQIKTEDITKKQVISERAKKIMADNNIELSCFNNIPVVSYSTVVNFLRKNKKGNKLSKKIIKFKENYDKNDLILMGDYNSCLIAFEIFKSQKKYNPVFFCGNFEAKEKIHKIQNINFSNLKELKKKKLNNLFYCSESESKDSQKEIKLVLDLGFKFISCIDNFVSISNSAKIDEGCLIMPGCVIGPHVKIGKFCKILNMVNIAHHSNLENNITIADGSHVGGNVAIGENSYVGIGVNINKRVQIGKNCTIVSGVTVTDFVSDNSILRLKDKKEKHT